jgi:hypothetical protein
MYQLVSETVLVELGSGPGKRFVVATRSGPDGVEQLDREAIGPDGGVSAFAVVCSRFEAFGYVLVPAASSPNKAVYSRIFVPEDLLETSSRRTADARMIQTLDAYLTQYPNDSHVLYNRALACWWVNDWAGVKEYAGRALRANPKRYDAMCLFGEALAEFGETAAAVQYANAAFAFEQANGVDDGRGSLLRQRLGVAGPTPPFTFTVPTVQYYDGRRHDFFDPTCTLSGDALIIQDRRGSVQQTLLRDIASVETLHGLMGLVAGSTVRIKIGTTAALDINCSNKSQQQIVLDRIRRAIAGRY